MNNFIFIRFERIFYILNDFMRKYYKYQNTSQTINFDFNKMYRVKNSKNYKN